MLKERKEKEREGERKGYINNVTGSNFHFCGFFLLPREKKQTGSPYLFRPGALSSIVLSVILPGRTRQHRGTDRKFSRAQSERNSRKYPASMSRVTRATDNINEPILATTTSRRARARAWSSDGWNARGCVIVSQLSPFPCFMREPRQIMGNPVGHRKKKKLLARSFPSTPKITLSPKPQISKEHVSNPFRRG